MRKAPTTDDFWITCAKEEGDCKPWTCGARKQGTAGGNDPADCSWPICGCAPYADKVIAALDEMGVLKNAG